MKLYTRYEQNGAIRSGVIAISVSDLMTLNLNSCCGIIFTKFKLSQHNNAFVTCNDFLLLVGLTLCHAVILTFDPLTSNFYSTLDRVWCHVFKLSTKF